MEYSQIAVAIKTFNDLGILLRHMQVLHDENFTIQQWDIQDLNLQEESVS